MLKFLVPNLPFSALGAATLLGAAGLHAGEYYGGGGDHGIVDRYMMQMNYNMEAALAAIERGDESAREKDWGSAVTSYREAVDLLPDAPATQHIRGPAIERYINAALIYSHELAQQGKFEEARGHLDTILTYDPNNKEARKMLEGLYDPERYPIAVTPAHLANIDKVKKHLAMAWSAMDAGRYDESNEQFKEVLRIDRYNSAARRGMEDVENKKTQYYDAARDHTRARMLAEVSAAWESPVPALNLDTINPSGPTTLSGDGKLLITAKLRSIILDRVSLQDTSLSDAIEYLRQKAQAMDTMDTNPDTKGVMIVDRSGPEAAARPVSLNVTHVPLGEALRYITEMTQTKFKIDPYAVVIVPMSDDTNEMVVRSWQVPPSFIPPASENAGGGAGGDAGDPFAKDGGGAGTIGNGLSGLKQQTAKEVLSSKGITFPDGATATYDKGTSTLTVRNTPAQIDAVEAYVNIVNNQQPRQLYITTKFVEVSQRNTDELGFDWLLGPLSIGSGAFGGGGTRGSSLNLLDPSGGNYPFESGGVPIGGTPITGGIRSGATAITRDSIDSLILGIDPAATLAPGIMSIAGVLTDPQFQVVMRGLSQKKGVDLMTAPSVTTRSGQRAKIEVIREFIYPIEFEPPEIPQTVGASNTGNNGGVGGIISAASVSSFPVTPTTPTAFEMRPVGVSMEVDPVLGPDNQTIDITLAPEVVEFEGFINYGSPIQSAAINALGVPTTIVLTPNVINQPIFASRRVSTSVTIWDGQTVALGGLMREDTQIVDDKVPILGDIPLLGRLFQNKAEETYKRNLMIFVTVKIIDPAGQGVRPANSNLEDLNQYLDRGARPQEQPAPPFVPMK